MERNQELADQVSKLFDVFASGDLSHLASLVSQEEDVLGIGTDPEEWWQGHAAVLRAFQVQVPEMSGAGMRFRLNNLVALSEGSVGWTSDRVTLVLPGNAEIPLRYTGVWRQEDGAWKMVQFHISAGVANEDMLGAHLTV